MRYLTLAEILRLHRWIIERSGGSDGIRDKQALDSAIAQPRMTFGGEDLYPTLQQKAAALLLSLVLNHPFVDGNKRIGQTACETFLLLNGFEIVATVDEQEQLILDLAAGKVDRPSLEAWLTEHLEPNRDFGS